MIKTLYSVNGIKYQVIKEGRISTYENIDAAIRDEFQIGSAVADSAESTHYKIMEAPSNLGFMGRIFDSAEPRICNGSYTMFEYRSPFSESVCWFVTTMDKRVMAVFALREQAMKYIHDKECR